MNHGNTANHREAGPDFNTLRVGIEQPGFFPYARFPLSGSHDSQTIVKPLSLNREPAIWPALMESKTVKPTTAANRKKLKN
jgi:hypothetical protein